MADDLTLLMRAAAEARRLAPSFPPPQRGPKGTGHESMRPQGTGGATGSLEPPALLGAPRFRCFAPRGHHQHTPQWQRCHCRKHSVAGDGGEAG